MVSGGQQDLSAPYRRFRSRTPRGSREEGARWVLLFLRKANTTAKLRMVAVELGMPDAVAAGTLM